MTHPIPNVLTIAGSDSGGGAGIQADLKTFSALGAYGASVITALTAQNTRGVSGVHAPDAAFVTAQLDAVFDDIRIDAVKIGMLANAAIVQAVADALRRYAPRFVVLDTVMISKSSHALLAPDAVDALRDVLLPLATVVTPNLPEAAALLGDTPATTEDEMVRQGQALLQSGANAVLMKAATCPMRPRAPTGSSMRRMPYGSAARACRSATRTARAARCRRRSPRCCRSGRISRVPYARRRST